MKQEKTAALWDKTLVRASRSLFVFHYVNPLNLRSERRAFFEARKRGANYSPRYRHPRIPENLRAIRRDLAALPGFDGEVSPLFTETRRYLLDAMRLVRSIGGADVTDASAALYGMPPQREVAAAREYALRLRPANPSAFLSPKRACAEFKKALRRIGIAGWRVDLSGRLSSDLLVDPVRRSLLLRRGHPLREDALRGLVAHEIEGHVYRYENGLRQPYRIFAFGLDRYVPTEEGLGSLLEERLGDAAIEAWRKYAGRVLAVHWSIEHGFIEVFDRLRELFSPEEAYKLTERAKRGLRDTSRPGAFVKDHVYWTWGRRLRRMSERKIRILYAGKIGAHQLPAVERLIERGKLREPHYLPEFLRTGRAAREEENLMRRVRRRSSARARHRRSR